MRGNKKFSRVFEQKDKLDCNKGFKYATFIFEFKLYKFNSFILISDTEQNEY